MTNPIPPVSSPALDASDFVKSPSGILIPKSEAPQVFEKKVVGFSLVRSEEPK